MKNYKINCQKNRSSYYIYSVVESFLDKSCYVASFDFESNSGDLFLEEYPAEILNSVASQSADALDDEVASLLVLFGRMNFVVRNY